MHGLENHRVFFTSCLSLGLLHSCSLVSASLHIFLHSLLILSGQTPDEFNLARLVPVNYGAGWGTELIHLMCLWSTSPTLDSVSSQCSAENSLTLPPWAGLWLSGRREIWLTGPGLLSVMCGSLGDRSCFEQIAVLAWEAPSSFIVAQHAHPFTSATIELVFLFHPSRSHVCIQFLKDSRRE